MPDLWDTQYLTYRIPNIWLIRYLIPYLSDTLYLTHQIPNTWLIRYPIPDSSETWPCRYPIPDWSDSWNLIYQIPHTSRIRYSTSDSLDTLSLTKEKPGSWFIRYLEIKLSTIRPRSAMYPGPTYTFNTANPYTYNKPWTQKTGHG